MATKYTPEDGGPPQWKTRDGIWFDDEAEANAHETAKDDDATASAYVREWFAAQDPEPAKRARTQRYHVVMDFLAWQGRQS